MPTSRAPTRLTAVARSALPYSVRPKNRYSAPISTTLVPTTSRLCALNVSAPICERRAGEAGVREPSAPKNHRPRPVSAKCTRDRDDQQHQHARVGERLVGDPVQQRPERGHGGERQQHLHRQRQRARRRPPDERGDRAAEHRATARAAAAAGAIRRARTVATRLDDGGDDRHADQQPDRAGRLAELQARERQRAVGDELARRDQDDARDGEHQHQRERQQRVDRAVGDAVLRSGDAAIERSIGRLAMRLRRHFASTQLPFSILIITRARCRARCGPAAS